MNYGFIGTGTISEAMVEGMLSSSLPVGKVYLSPRNAEVAASLEQKFENVQVMPDNQAVADASDITILAVRPQVAEEVLGAIRFPGSTKIISVIAATDHDKLAAWTGKASGEIVRSIPLPFVSYRDGVTAIFPPNDEAETLFNAIGTAVQCASRHEFDLLAAASSTMGAYFGIMGALVDWLVQKGMEETKAKSYVVPLFGSLSHVATQSPGKTMNELKREFSTPGGLNEQVFRDFHQNGGTQAFSEALDCILRRIVG